MCSRPGLSGHPRNGNLKKPQYRKNYAEKVLIGEVSTVNDDTCDNCLQEACGRFPAIEEDAQPLHYLGNEYPAARASRSGAL